MKRGVGLLAAALWLAVLLGPSAALAQNGAVARGGTATFPTFEVNIDDGGRLGRLRIGFEVLLTDEQGARMAVSGQVREALLLFFRDKTAAALLAPRGKEALRAELLRQINAVIGGPRAIKLYFLDYCVIRAEKP
ncbi:MAG: flagellar basal body-associated protein FliL [Acidobacteriota bacterium]